ncbi:MAG TPA: hypothetical protein DIT89_09970 [Planctomycetaceae bacterium]|nr:hypothetical protein [Planctomycetaceae bacterium]
MLPSRLAFWPLFMGCRNRTAVMAGDLWCAHVYERVVFRLLLVLLTFRCGLLPVQRVSAEDLTSWRAFLPASPQSVLQPEAGRVVLQGAEWTWLAAPRPQADVLFDATVQLETAATQFSFFGSSWSAWPDPKFEDRGFEAGLLLRCAEDGSSGYRVQLSSKYQECAVVRFPDGGYVRSVPCEISLGRPLRLTVTLSGGLLRLVVDGRELLTWVDRLGGGPVSGIVAVGASSGGRVTFSDVSLQDPGPQPHPAAVPHVLRLSSRRWLGGRQFVFDDNEPILQLHDVGDPSMFAKLRPGLKPLLTFDSHWGLENQGAYREASVEWTEARVTGGGESLRAEWSAKHVQGRFTTGSLLQVGFDHQRQVYTYEIESELQVLPGDPFVFRYGFDFEHHTPLDPFRWRYLLIRGGDGDLTYRPLAPFDPGPLDDIQSVYGLRAWHGRTGEQQIVAPAVEYLIQPEWLESKDEQGQPRRRQLNTAVCAAFYDTGVSFAPTTGRAGDRVRVRYRYTGYPAEETERLFGAAKVQNNPRIDPRHHFVFAGEQWPVIRFGTKVSLDQPWWGGRPFLSGHNQRPSYDVVEADGGQLRLGPVSWAVAPIGPEHPSAGRWLMTVRVKSVNTVGPGGRVELLCLKKADAAGNGYVLMDSGNVISRQTGWFGAGSAEWRDLQLVVDVPEGTGGLALGLGNAGTGEVLISEVRFAALADGQSPSSTMLVSVPETAAVPGAIWDLRLSEQSGLYAFNAGAGEHRVLELANVDWVQEGGRRAIRFSENPKQRADYPALGLLDTWLRHPQQRLNYEPHRHGAFGLGGFHGGGRPLRALTLLTWIRPSREMGAGPHPGRADLIGYGARRFILGLEGQTAPYRLGAWLNVNDHISSEVMLEAERWAQVAMTCEPVGENWRVRLYVDGQQVGEGMTEKLRVSDSVPDSLILGAEYFYLHCHYYRGLMGPVQVIERCLTSAELVRVGG